MKRKIRPFVILLLLAMFFSIFFLAYENHSYQRQIEERDSFIRELLVRDSIASKLVNIEDQDSMLIYKYVVGEDGNAIKYNDLAEELSYYRKQAEIKDKIIVSAKRKYRFNYSIKESGDTLIIVFWDKRKVE